MCRLPAPLLALVSTVMGPIGDGLRPSCRNMVDRNASAVAAGVGLGFGVGLGLGLGVGLATGVGVGVGVDPGVLLETLPQPPRKKMNIPKNKTRITLRKKASQ